MRKPLHFYWFVIFLVFFNFQGKVIEFPLLCNTFKFFLNFHWKPLHLHHSVILRSFFRTFRKKPWNFRLKTFRFDCFVIIWFRFELYEETIAFLLICNISSFFLPSREKCLNFHCFVIYSSFFLTSTENLFISITL